MKSELLWVVWQNPTTRKKYHVGNLAYTEDSGYTFKYNNSEKPRGLHDAQNNGFVSFFAFPNLSKTYNSNFLFHTFSRRLPNKTRPDYNPLLHSYGLHESAHEMEILRVTKGKTATDSYELVSPISADKDNNFNVDFYIEGWRYHDGEKALTTLKPNQELLLIREPNNEHDKYAVKVLTSDNMILGYIPAVYSEFFSELLKEDECVRMKINSINREAIPQLKLFVNVSGKLPNLFRIEYPNLLFPVQPELEFI